MILDHITKKDRCTLKWGLSPLMRTFLVVSRFLYEVHDIVHLLLFMYFMTLCVLYDYIFICRLTSLQFSICQNRHLFLSYLDRLLTYEVMTTLMFTASTCNLRIMISWMFCTCAVYKSIHTICLYMFV